MSIEQIKELKLTSFQSDRTIRCVAEMAGTHATENSHRSYRAHTMIFAFLPPTHVLDQKPKVNAPRMYQGTTMSVPIDSVSWDGKLSTTFALPEDKRRVHKSRIRFGPWQCRNTHRFRQMWRDKPTEMRPSNGQEVSNLLSRNDSKLRLIYELRFLVLAKKAPKKLSKEEKECWPTEKKGEEKIRSRRRHRRRCKKEKS